MEGMSFDHLEGMSHSLEDKLILAVLDRMRLSLVSWILLVFRIQILERIHIKSPSSNNGLQFTHLAIWRTFRTYEALRTMRQRSLMHVPDSHSACTMRVSQTRHCVSAALVRTQIGL